MSVYIELFPAPAGMIPRVPSGSRFQQSFPRTRGDDPRPRPGPLGTADFSPHPRG